MQELVELLSKEPKTVFLQTSQAQYEKELREKFAEWFTKIASHLMSNYVIEAGGVQYRLLEIEFYYYSEQHNDETTYGYAKDWATIPEKDRLRRIYRHKSAQRNQLTWFVHYSGIDITIGDGNNPGGILIRSIQRRKENGTTELIDGPLKVLLELMNQGMKVDGSNAFQLILKRESGLLEAGEEIKQQKRIGINSGGYEKEEYNFFVHPPIKPAPTPK